MLLCNRKTKIIGSLEDLTFKLKNRTTEQLPEADMKGKNLSKIEVELFRVIL
jgi:hypothetical protein